MRFNLRHSASLTGLILICVLILFSFQNCSAPIDEATEASNAAANLPFAFDSRIDHLSYMSCSNLVGAVNKETFYTFKAGAYEGGSGIRLRDDFLYSARNLTRGQKVDAIAQSPANKNAYLQMSLRENQRFQRQLFTGSTYYSIFAGDLSVSSITTPLAALINQNRVNTFSGQPLQDKIHLFTTETNATDIRTDLQNGNIVLALGYGRTTSKPEEALAPTAGSNSSVYGQGFVMSFKTGHGLDANGNIVNFTSGSTRVMYNVREYNLETGTQIATWVCPPELTFMIVRQADAIGTRCGSYQTEPPASATRDIVRRILPQSQWGVNLSQRCVVPKSAADGDCYGNAPAINYTGPACDPTTNNCPQYISICRRQ